MTKEKRDIVIVGAGSAGLTVAVGLTKLGKNPLLLYKQLGGECTNSGCVPSKRFLHLVNQPSFSSFSRPFSDIRRTVDHIRAEEYTLLKEAHIDYYEGSVEFVGPQELELTDKKNKKKRIQFGTAILATGSSPLRIPIPGLPEQMILTNENVFQLSSLPQSLVILGGGPIGAELSTAFAKAGSKVSLIIRSQLLPREILDTVEIVRSRLENLGVHIYEGVHSQTYNPKDKNLILQDKQKKQIAEITKPNFVLQAIGRVPNTDINLEAAGITYSAKGIHVNSSFQTSNKHVYAIGDCIVGPKFTHLAYNQGVFLTQKLVFPLAQPPQGPLPAVTFTDPPIASVGTLTEDELTRKFVLDLSTSDRSVIENKQNMKAIVFVDMLTGRIRGVTLVGEAAEHLITFFSLALFKKVSVFAFAHLIIPYPTYASAFSQLYGIFLGVYIKQLPRTILTYLRIQIHRIIVALFWLGVSGTLVYTLSLYDFDAQRVALLLNQLFTSEFGIVLFFLAYILRAFLSLPATLLSVLGGSLYGFWLGLVLTILASNTSSMVAYFLGNTVFAGKKEEEESPSGFKQSIRENTFETVLVGRLTYFPYDLLSYIAGGLGVSFWQFMLATALGSLPGSIAIVSFGAGIENILNFQNFRLEPQYFLLGLVLLVVSLVLSKILKKNNLKK